MSEKSKIVTEENVVLTVDDIDNLEQYCQYFGVDMSEDLEKACNNFKEDQSYSNQVVFLREFCTWITTSDHRTFKDPLWEKPQEASNQLLPELLFDKKLDEVLNEADSEES